MITQRKRKDTYCRLRNHGSVGYEAREISIDLVCCAEDFKKSLLKDFKRRVVTISIVIIPVGIDKVPRWGYPMEGG